MNNFWLSHIIPKQSGNLQTVVVLTIISMFGLTARKPNLGGKVFVPQKPAPKPVAPPTPTTNPCVSSEPEAFSPAISEVVKDIKSAHEVTEIPATSTSATATTSPAIGSTVTSATTVAVGTQPKISILPGAKSLAKKVSFAPVSQAKKVAVTPATSNSVPQQQEHVDTIMESAKALQQLSSHQTKPLATQQSLKGGSSDSEEDDEALAIHFTKPKGKASSSKTAMAEKAAASARQGPGQKKVRKVDDMSSSSSPGEMVAASSSSVAFPKLTPPSLQRLGSNTSNSSTDANSTPATKKPRTPKSPSETTPRSPRSVASKKAKASLHIFPLSYGNPAKIERVTSYVRINQEGVEGLTFVNEDERPVVAEISSSFPNNAGIKVRDVVISVNNLDAKYAKYDQLMSALICRNPSSPKDAMELTGIIEKNSTYESIACIVFARPISSNQV